MEFDLKKSFENPKNKAEKLKKVEPLIMGKTLKNLIKSPT